MSNFIKLVTFITIFSLTGCSTHKLYNMAIDYERGRADLEVKNVKLDFGEVVYLDNNVKSDTTIVLLHGFGGDKDNWNRFSAELNGKTHIVVPDIPGHGDSVSDEKTNYSISHQANMLSIFLESIGVREHEGSALDRLSENSLQHQQIKIAAINF